MQNKTIQALKKSGRMPWVFTATILLVILTDLLLFDADSGNNFFLRTIAFASAITSLAWRRRRFHQGVAGFITTLILSLPLIESATLLSLLLATLGLGLAALMAVPLLPDRLEHIPPTLVRLLLPAPTRLARDVAGLRPPIQQQAARRASLWLVAWIVPLGLGAVFACLFAAANPLIETVLSTLQPQAMLALFDSARLLFWLIVATVTWALLRPRLPRRRHRKVATPVSAPKDSSWLGSAAIFRSLVVFNGLFAIQTLLDLAYLWVAWLCPTV